MGRLILSNRYHLPATTGYLAWFPTNYRKIWEFRSMRWCLIKTSLRGEPLVALTGIEPVYLP